MYFKVMYIHITCSPTSARPSDVAILSGKSFFLYSFKVLYVSRLETFPPPFTMSWIHNLSLIYQFSDNQISSWRVQQASIMSKLFSPCSSNSPFLSIKCFPSLRYKQCFLSPCPLRYSPVLQK